jgi:hypothetical protein
VLSGWPTTPHQPPRQGLHTRRPSLHPPPARDHWLPCFHAALPARARRPRAIADHRIRPSPAPTRGQAPDPLTSLSCPRVKPPPPFSSLRHRSCLSALVSSFLFRVVLSKMKCVSVALSIHGCLASTPSCQHAIGSEGFEAASPPTPCSR